MNKSQFACIESMRRLNNPEFNPVEFDGIKLRVDFKIMGFSA